jgi:hypothetical protein
VRKLLFVPVLLLGIACVEAAEPPSEPLCHPVQWQACEAGCGRGVQQCTDAGDGWGACQCVVYDAGG